MSRSAAVQVRLVRMALVAVLSCAPLGSSAQEFTSISPEAADFLGSRIQEIRQRELDTERAPAEDTIRVSEIEMESFVLFWMEEDIPPRVDSIDVRVTDGIISAETELTFDAENRTGNVIVDTLFEGTHTFFAEGALIGDDGRGQFELREVRLDGLAIPLVVVEVLVDRFVKSRYPDVDLDASFTIPWGIDEIRLMQGVAEIGY